MPHSSIADALLSKTRQRVLGLLYGQPDKHFYANEIVRCANMGRGTVRRELDRLLSAGLLTVTKVGNQLHYQANKHNPVYRQLRALVEAIAISAETEHSGENVTPDKDKLLITKSLMIPRADLENLAQRYHIKRLVLFGSAARGQLQPDSDIDLLVEFEENNPPSLGGMVKLKDDFSALFGGRKVDVATPSILNNPYRQQAIKRDMKELYAA